MKQKVKDLLVILFIYSLALLAAIFTLKYAPIPDTLWKTALATAVATVVVFVFSLYYKNASVYDPYWSAAPVFIGIYWLFNSTETDFYYKFIWVMIVLWGVRLTWNWILRWDGFEDEDWRYTHLRKKTGKMYWLVNLLGIHLLPTFLVFLALTPVYFVFNSSVSSPTSWLLVPAVLFTLGAIYLEKTADDLLRQHIKSGKSKTERLQKHVWGLVPYPNYMGEICFWWGLYFTAIAVDYELWWTVYGPVSITLLFVFVSIPMMRKRLKNKSYN